MASLSEVRSLKRRWYNLIEAQPTGFGIAPHESGWALKVNTRLEPQGDVPTELDGITLVVEYVGEVVASAELNACVPDGCQCACHNPGRGMSVAHLVACCDKPPAPVERFGLKLSPEDFNELGEALDRVTEAEKRLP